MDNTNLSIKRTPDLIAAEINSIKIQTRSLVLYNSIEIGRRLTEAKELVSHGEWGKWLERSVEYSQSTAQNLMRIFNEFGADQITLLGDNAKSQALGNLSYTQAVALLGIPADEREQFIADHDIDNMSTRELQQAVKEKEEALKQAEEFKKLANDKSEEAIKSLEDKNKTEQVLRETKEDVRVLRLALKQEKEKSKDGITKLQQEIKELKGKLSEAEGSEDNDEIERLRASLEETEKELESATRKAQELEKQLNEKPIEASVTIEDLPEEVEKELDTLRTEKEQAEKRIKELESKSSNPGNDVVIKFSIYFESLVKGFNDLLKSLDGIKAVDAQIYNKYRNAVSGLIGKMTERL